MFYENLHCEKYKYLRLHLNYMLQVFYLQSFFHILVFYIAVFIKIFHEKEKSLQLQAYPDSDKIDLVNYLIMI